jgi:hypothetical protein
MRPHWLLSDQSITWSERFAATIIGCAAQASRGTAAAVTSAARCAARLAHRALQALRQARLQVRGGPRAWPEVLPVSELSEAATGDGLRTTGVRRSGSYKPGSLSARPRDPRADLRDQPRVTASTRGALRCAGERHSDAHRLDRQSVRTRNTHAETCVGAKGALGKWGRKVDGQRCREG